MERCRRLIRVVRYSRDGRYLTRDGGLMAGNHDRRGTVAHAAHTIAPKTPEGAASTQRTVFESEDDIGEPVAFSKMTLSPEESAVFRLWYDQATSHPVEPPEDPSEATRFGSRTRP